MTYPPSKFTNYQNYIAVLLLVTLLSLTACSNQHQLTFKSGNTTETLADGKTAVPDEFKNLIFPDATAAGSVSSEGENSEESKFLMLSCKQPADAVSKWYQDKLKSESWKMINVQEQPGSISIIGHKNNVELNIMIAEENGTTNISLSEANQVEDNSANDENNRENYSPDKSTPPTD